MRITTAVPGPEVSGSPTAPVVLLLHGYGSHERDLVGLTSWLPAGLRWVSLRAPGDMGFGGYEWFPLSLPDEPSQAGADAAVEAVWEWVDASLPDSAPVVPLGFSQGGLMALELLRTRPQRVPAAVCLSGFVTASRAQSADAAFASARPPVFWGRGLLDQVIWPAAVARTATWLEAHTTLTRREYPELAHGVDPGEMDEVAAFLRETVAAPK
ncbi:alpha/beta hydrolase [Demequina sp. NBRC 110055]|uniref:alpha/beta hydrolase n=1 Tax=Demequina sp. NBRC 110055 TaxID=1570344 RepID=UPI0009FD38A1|nr:alpha/beta hydrolase-fold protein [Demequina sp. NBRC 110055]